MSSFTMEKVLANAKTLVTRLKDHETTADTLLLQAQELSKKVDSMKSYQDNIGTLNEMAKQRQPADIVFGLFQENSEIVDLHRENADLRYSLDEHQLAIELIMSRYREQVTQLVSTNRSDRAALCESPDHTQEVDTKIGQICEMAGVMWNAVDVDSAAEIARAEQLARVKLENETLRDLLTAGKQSLESPLSTRASQTVTGDPSEQTLSTVDEESTAWNHPITTYSRARHFHPTQSSGAVDHGIERASITAVGEFD